MADITVTEGQWHHLAVTWDAVNDTAQIILDGVSVFSGATTAGFMPTLSSVVNILGIGGVTAKVGVAAVLEATGGDNLNAHIDGLTVWDKNLTAAQVALLFSATGSPLTSGDPSYQDGANGSSFRVAPSHILAHIPFDDDESLGPATVPIASATGYTQLGSSFGFRANVEAAAATGTVITLDLEANVTSPDTNESSVAITWTGAINESADQPTKNLYKIFDRSSGGSATAELVRVDTWVDSTDTVNVLDALQNTYTNNVAQFQRNLIADGDFEITGGLTGVSFWSDVSTPTVSLETASIVSQGLQSAKIVGTTGEGIVQDIQNGEAAIGGATYDGLDWVVHFDFYPTMAVSGSGQISFMETTGGMTSTTGDYFVAMDQFTDWGDSITQNAWNEMCYVHTGDVCTWESFAYLLLPSNGTAYYDNMHLQASELKGGKYLRNGGAWSMSAWASGVLITAQSECHSGKSTSRVAIPAGGTATGTQTMDMTGRNGVRFLAVAYCKLIATAADATATINIKDGGSNVLATQTETISDGAVTGDYTKVSCIFAADTDNGNSHTFEIVLTGSSGDFWYVDDIYVTELGPVPGAVKPMAEEHSVVPAKDQVGMLFTPGNEGISISQSYMNPNEFGWLVRFRPQYSSDHSNATERPLFEWFINANDSVRLEYINGKYVAVWRDGGLEVALTPSTASSFVHDSIQELSGWFDTEGRTIDGTTYYGKLFLNGTEIASTVSSIAALDQAQGTSYVGADNAGNSAYAVIDEIYLMTQAPTDGECQAHYVQGSALHNDNRAFSWSQSIKAGDHVRLDTFTQTMEVFNSPDTPEDASNPATRSALGASTGTPPSIKPYGTRKGWVLISESTKEVRLSYRKEFI